MVQCGCCVRHQYTTSTTTTWYSAGAVYCVLYSSMYTVHCTPTCISFILCLQCSLASFLFCNRIVSFLLVSCTEKCYSFSCLEDYQLRRLLVTAFHTVVGHLREIPQRIEPSCEPLLLSVSCLSVCVPAFHTVVGHLREIPQRIEPSCEPLLLSVSCSLSAFTCLSYSCWSPARDSSEDRTKL